MPKDKKTLAFVIRRTYRIVVDSSHRDVAQPGSAFAWGASGRWFESSHPDHFEKIKTDTEKCPLFLYLLKAQFQPLFPLSKFYK